MALRRTLIHRIALGPHLFLGAEPRLVACASLWAFALIAAGQQWWTVGLAVALWCSALWGFRRMAKADPYRVQTYVRSLRYRAYYPAHSTPFRTSSRGSIWKHPHY